MCSILIEILKPDLTSIVRNYLLPHKNEFKTLYSSIIIDPRNPYLLDDRTTIEKKYYYFKLREMYKNYSYIRRSYVVPSVCIIIYNETVPFTDTFLYKNTKISKHLCLIGNGEIGFYIQLIDITYSDIIKCIDEEIKREWFKLQINNK
jgi:hypothetical protein